VLFTGPHCYICGILYFKLNEIDAINIIRGLELFSKNGQWYKSVNETLFAGPGIVYTNNMNNNLTLTHDGFL
jgi:hypothetical protein